MVVICAVHQRILLGVYTLRSSTRLVGPKIGTTGRMKRLHVPIVDPTCRPYPGYVRLVGQTSQADRSGEL